MTVEERDEFEIECQEMRAINMRGWYSLMEPVPAEVVDGMRSIGTTIGYDVRLCKLTLSGGDPELNTQVMAIWKNKPK